MWNIDLLIYLLSQLSVSKLVINVMLLKMVGQFFNNRNKNLCVNFIILFINYFNLVDCFDLDCYLHQFNKEEKVQYSDE